MGRFSKKLPGRKGSTDSKHSPVFSYYNNRPADTLSSSAQRGRTSYSAVVRRHLRHLPTYMAGVIIVVSLMYATTLNTNPKILVGRPRGASVLLRSQTEYGRQISQLLSASVFNRNKLTMSTDKIASQIQQKFPEIQTATVSLPIIGRRPIIGLDPAEPTIILNTKSTNYIIGSDGRVLINLSNVAKKEAISLPIVQDDSGLQPEQGRPALPKANVDFITTVLTQLRDKQISVERMDLPAVANELRVTPKGEKYYVKFNLGSDPRQQAGTYLAVRDKLSSNHITPAEYIDVRVDERAYYK